MNLSELYELIEIPEGVVDRLRQCEETFRLEQAEPFLLGMMNGETARQAYADLKAFLGDDAGSFRILLCQLECARRCYETYRAMGISDRIFADTMKCFTRFLREYERIMGEMCFDRGWWTYRQISMRLFRIGELEYELHPSPRERTVHLHIPSDAKFAPEKVDESLEAADRFIARHFPDYSEARRVCDSWLLSPRLKDLLPEGSNILHFQRRFAILEDDPENREYMDWIFWIPGIVVPSCLPEDTSLQRNAKRFILEGGNIGSAYGELR